MTSPSSDVQDGAASAALSPVKAAAIEYAGYGWGVIRLNGNVPLAGSRGIHEAALNPGEVASWPENGFNVGIVTGGTMPTGDVFGANLLVIDIDHHAGVDGGESLHDLEHRHGALPRTASATTPNHGEHLYFYANKDLRCSVGKLGPGLDIRCMGGFAVAPPSADPETGRAWAWDISPAEMSPAWLPDWVAGLLREPERPRARPVGEWRELAAAGATEGSRNDSVAKLTGHLLARGVDPFVALELILAWNRARNMPPLGDDEVARTVDSIARREAAKWS
jgi:bifunctional DNA primase/polymerase-like protein/primase-like protein